MDIKKILFKTSVIDTETALPDALILCAKDGRILWVNDKASEIFETPKMHLLTSNIESVIENALALISGAALMHRAVITKLVDKEMYYDMTAKETDEGFVLDFRDAAPDKIQNDGKNEKINREKNNFFIKLSNDIKAPLQSIIGFSQAMIDGLGGKMSEQQEKYIKIINKNSTELMYFMSKLLEFSQTESALKYPENKTFDVVSLVNSVVRFNEQKIKEKELKISIITDEALKKTISSDEEILRYVLQDSLEIILKSVDMGEISIAVTNPNEKYLSSKNIPNGAYTLISLSSSAFLLSENDLECMFDPYKILDSSNRKNVLRAIVLGSVRNMVLALKGTIWIESQILKNTSLNILIPHGV